jgi:hypothetical protein
MAGYVQTTGFLCGMKQLDTRVAGLNSPATFHFLHGLSLLLLLLGLAAPATQAQAPTWEAALPVALPAAPYQTLATAATADGVYVAGTFSQTVRFGTTTLTTSGPNTFVAKWRKATRSYAWAVATNVGSGNELQVHGLAVGPGVVYLMGTFRGSNVQLGSTVLNPASGSTVGGFVARLTEAGGTASVGWVQALTSTDDITPTALALVGSTLYLGGYARGNVAFGPTSVTTDPQGMAYVAKLLDAGSTATWAWVQPLGSTGTAFVTALALTSGGLYVGGEFRTPSVTIGSTTLLNAGNGTANSGGPDVFVTKLLDTGSTPSIGWVQHISGPDYDHLYSMAVQGSNLYLTGKYYSPVLTLGPLRLRNTDPRAITGTDLYVSKLRDNGGTADFVWAHTAGGISSEEAGGVAVQGSAVYLAGRATGTSATFGSLTLPVSTSLGFVSRLTDAGATASYDWVVPAGRAVTRIQLADNWLYVLGSSHNPDTFGPYTLGTPPSTYTEWLAALADPLLLAQHPAVAPALTVLPNPAQHHATVQLSAVSGSPLLLTLTDALGRPVRTAPVPPAQLTAGYPLDLAGLAPGLYLVRLSSGSTQLTRRLVVE